MAIIIKDLYPGRVDTGDPGYPLGKAQDRTTPGNGTPLRKDWLNDDFGFKQALLDRVSATATGIADKVGASQYLDAMLQIISEGTLDSNFYTAAGTNTITLTELPDNVAVSALSEGIEVRFVAVADNTGIVAIEFDGQPSLTKFLYLDRATTDLSGGEIVTGQDINCVFSVAADGWILKKVQDASETVKGVVEKATTLEAQTATPDKFIDSERLHETIIGGVGQSWQDVKASRTDGVTYTNTTGRLIMVSVYCDSDGSNTRYTATVGGVLVVNFAHSGAGQRAGATFPVKNGDTYSINSLLGTINTWTELR